MITPSFGLTATERVLPKLALDFTTASLDSRITFTRTTGASNPATFVNSSGAVTAATNNQPRFDYDPVTLACKGLLIEESRTNSITPSGYLQVSRKLTISGLSGSFTDGESVTSTGGGTGVYVAGASSSTLAALKGTSGTFSGTLTGVSSGATATISASTAAWRLSNGTLTENAAVSPDGTSNAFLLSATGANCEFYNTAAITAGTAYTSSIYVKRKTGTGALQIRNSANTAWLTVTPSTSNWTRINNDGGNSGGTGYCDLLVVTSGDEFYIWSAQLEAGAFATSYIPTTTTSLTRNADVVSMTGTNFSDWYNASEGTFAVNCDTRSGHVFNANDGTSNNRIALFGQLSMFAAVGGVTQVNQAVGVTGINVLFGATISYKLNSYLASLNGAASVSDTSATVPTVNQLSIGKDQSTTNYINGHIAKLLYWPMQLTANEVRAFSKLG